MKALCGYATLYNRPILHYDVWKMVAPGAFNKSLASGRTIKLLLHHSDSECLGSTRDNLQLYSDGSVGLAFRARLPNTEHGRTALWMAENKQDGMSIGFNYHEAKKQTRTINGVDVVCIIEADLYEISFLYGEGLGAVQDAYATLKDTDFSKSLREECTGGQYLYHGAAIGFTRSLQKLMNT